MIIEEIKDEDEEIKPLIQETNKQDTDDEILNMYENAFNNEKKKDETTQQSKKKPKQKKEVTPKKEK